MGADIQIWAMTDFDGSSSQTTITTLPMLKHLGECIKEDYFSNAEKNQELLIWFFNQGTKLRGNQGKKVVNQLFSTPFLSFAAVDQFFEKAKIYEYFELLELDDDDLYLEGEKTPKDYLIAAEKLTHSLPEESRASAAARIAMNCMVLAIFPDALSSRLRQALLAPWKRNDIRNTEASDGTTVRFSWQTLNDNAIPKLRVIKNPKMYPIELKLETQSHGAHSIWIPANSHLSAVYVGQYMTSIKGSLCINGDFAACKQGDQIAKYRISRDKYIQHSLPDPDGVQDFALHSNGRLHILEGDAAQIWDNLVQHTLPQIIGIYSLGDIWVAHKLDGSTYSNINRLNFKNIIAVTQNDEDILLLTRDLQVHSLSNRKYTVEDIWNCMISRFQNLPDDAAERITYQGREIIRTKEGNLLCRPLES